MTLCDLLGGHGYAIARSWNDALGTAEHVALTPERPAVAVIRGGEVEGSFVLVLLTAGEAASLRVARTCKDKAVDGLVMLRSDEMAQFGQEALVA